jgi:hypothetical protein
MKIYIHLDEHAFLQNVYIFIFIYFINTIFVTHKHNELIYNPLHNDVIYFLINIKNLNFYKFIYKDNNIINNCVIFFFFNLNNYKLFFHS